MELRPRDARPDSDPIDEAQERVRQALYDHLISFFYPTCTQVHERATQRRQEKKQKLDKRMSRWREGEKALRGSGRWQSPASAAPAPQCSAETCPRSFDAQSQM